MKALSILPLLFLSYKSVNAYISCSTCEVVSTNGGVNWGKENDTWCIIPSSCNTNAAQNTQCFTYPHYPCCQSCNVIDVNSFGRWGVENGQWCGIADSCPDTDPDDPTLAIPINADNQNKDDDTSAKTETEAGDSDEKTSVGQTPVNQTSELEELDPGNGERYCMKTIIKDKYTADPAPMVYGDTLYLYTTHDEDVLVNNFYTMLDWFVISTKDMVNWENHGVIFSLNDIEWADDRAWAAQCVERNGKFYLYCPVHKTNGGMAIAVGVADSPTGPFKDIGHPLVDEGDWNDIDPTVFIDDDGQAYLYFGNPELRYVLLNEDMVSIDESVGVVKVPMTEESFGKGSHETGTTYGEGPYFYKRKGHYYMVYAAFREGKNSESLGYSMSDSPTGPWKYGGTLMDEEGGVFTNHPGITDFRGHSYLFYHTGELPGGGGFHRSVCVTEFYYNEDGTMQETPKCQK